MLRVLRIRAIDPSIYKLQGQKIPKRCTHVSPKIFEFWKICLETCIYVLQTPGFVPNSIQLHILVDWNTYHTHAICNVYGEFIPPHLSLVLLYIAHDLDLIFPIAESINQLGQWKPQGHLHYSSWPTTMAQSNLMRKHWFFGRSSNSMNAMERVDVRSGSVLHIVTRISYCM